MHFHSILLLSGDQHQWQPEMGSDSKTMRANHAVVLIRHLHIDNRSKKY
jgi:hypothetical protein